jgi:glycosyltransferase involved in cell wall biosynthesis
VADFTLAVATALGARGEHVHVWSPAPAARIDPGVTLHPLPRGYQATALAALDRALDASPAPRRLFVQWVPHGYGYKSLNVPFCLWVRRRARRGDSVDLMVHEPFLPFARSRPRQSLGAIVHRAMLAILLSAAGRVWVSTSSFLPEVRRFGPRRPIPYAWLPVPSPIASDRDAAGVAALRAELPPGRLLVGYFGAANRLIAGCLSDALEAIRSQCPDVRFVLVGTGTDLFARRLADTRPALASSVVASGPRHSAEVSRLIQCCDLFVQPYPDGVSTRRTTLMALLAHGRPIVTNAGPRTEAFWGESRALALVPSDKGAELAGAAVALVGDPAARLRLSEQGRALYNSRFDVTQTVAALLGCMDSESPLSQFRETADREARPAREIQP